MRLVLILMLAMLVGCEQFQQSPNTTREKAIASVTLAKPTAPPPVKPDVNPAVCENCGGTGKVGDGRVFVPCPVCKPKGQAQVHQEAQKPVAKKPRVVMHTIPGCAPCRNWWNNSRPAWERQGWIVEEVEDLVDPGPFPWFHIEEGFIEFDGTL